MMNIQRQLKCCTRYPETTDIHSMVTGLPRIRKVLARERSARVNQWHRYTSIAGITAASTTPSMKRMTISM